MRSAAVVGVMQISRAVTFLILHILVIANGDDGVCEEAPTVQMSDASL